MKVILVYADSLRRDHLGAYNNDWIQTPNLDRFGSQATVFDNAYIGSFPTVPTRRDVLLGLGDIGVPFNRWKGFEGDEVTLSERLGEAGIPSMMVTDVQNTVTGNINMNRGFTAWALNRGQEGDPCWMDGSVPLEFPVPPGLIRYTAERWHQVLMNRADRKLESDWFAPGTYSMAIDWLERNYMREDFFLYVDTFDPHEPWDPPPWYENLYDPGFEGRRFDAPTYGVVAELGYSETEVKNIRARYAGEVTMVDTWFGRLMETVERLGIEDDTMVIFTSDHGIYVDYPGDNGLVCKPHMVGCDGAIMAAGRPPKKPLRYFPHWTGVCRIPLLVRAPGRTEGRRSPAIVQPWDLTATVLDAHDVDRPEQLWGQSLLPLLSGEDEGVREAAVLGNQAHAQVMTPRWSYAIWRGEDQQILYDLENDPTQSTDVSSEHADVVEKMREHLRRYLQNQDLEDLMDEYANGGEPVPPPPWIAGEGTAPDEEGCAEEDS